MLGIKMINIVLLIAVLLSLYTLIFQYRIKDSIIVKAKLINKELLNTKYIILLVICSVIGFSSIMMLLYSSIEEFHSTKSFRDEYAISFGKVINDDKIEKLVDELEGNQKEWGKWSLKKIRQSKILMIYVINMVCFIVLFPKIGTIRVENHGIRRFVFLTHWKEYASYFWKDDEINFLSLENKTLIKFRIAYQEKDILDKYLNEKTNLIEKEELN